MQPNFIYDWSILHSDHTLSTMLFNQLCFKTRTGIIVLRERINHEDEVIFREFERRGFEIDVLASSKLRHDCAHKHQRLNFARDNVFVFRRKTSRPRQSWIICNRDDKCRWHAQVDFMYRMSKDYAVPIVSHVKQGDSILDAAVDACRLHLGRYCSQGIRKLNLVDLGIFEAKNRGKCERSFVLDGEVSVLNRVVMRCVFEYTNRFNELYERDLRTKVYL